MLATGAEAFPFFMHNGLFQYDPADWILHDSFETSVARTYLFYYLILTFQGRAGIFQGSPYFFQGTFFLYRNAILATYPATADTSLFCPKSSATYPQEELAEGSVFFLLWH